MMTLGETVRRQRVAVVGAIAFVCGVIFSTQAATVHSAGQISQLPPELEFRLQKIESVVRTIDAGSGGIDLIASFNLAAARLNCLEQGQTLANFGCTGSSSNGANLQMLVNRINCLEQGKVASPGGFCAP